jgi:HK97 family phage prohead protease
MADELHIVRRFEPELELGDGRTIVGRLVPYGVSAEVADRLPDGSYGPIYREQHAAGSYARSARGAHRYLLDYEHERGLMNKIGRAVELDDRPDGLYGTFRAFDGAVGDQGLELIRSGAATGLSVQARIPPRSSRTLADGTVERTRAILESVALTSEPAYVGAGVLAVRSAGEAASRPRIDAVLAWRAEHALPSRPTT